MDDKRCCGAGACIINAEGLCWCDQRWDGDKLISSTPIKPSPPIKETEPSKSK